MPPRPPSMSPALPARPPAMPAPPASTESSCPPSGSGRRCFKKPTTVSTAVRACASEMPVRSVTCLTSSSIRMTSVCAHGRRASFAQAFESDEDHRLRVRYLEPFAAACVFADEHVVHAHEIVARFLEAGAILFARTARRLRLLCPAQPTHFIIGALAAVRTTKARAFRLWSLVKEISFIHSLLLGKRRFSVPTLSHPAHAQANSRRTVANKFSGWIGFGSKASAPCESARVAPPVP